LKKEEERSAVCASTARSGVVWKVERSGAD
jgi:hypothetical protein